MTATKSKKSASKSSKSDEAIINSLVLQGMGDVVFSETKSIEIDEAIKFFNYLWQYNKDYYVRPKTKLTNEELKIYQTILTVPKTGNSFYIRNLQAFLVWLAPDGKHYLINGNSRFQSMTELRKKDKSLEFAPITFNVIEGNLTKEQIQRFQFDLNDTTRKNPAIETHRRIYQTYQDAVDSGIEPTQARKYVCEYYGKSNQTISNAIKLQNIPQLLEDLLDSDNATTEGIVKTVQAAEALKLEPEVVAGMVLAHAKKAELTENNVKRWRKEYEDNLKRAEEEARLQAEQEEQHRQAQEQAKEQRSEEEALRAVIGKDTVINEIKEFEEDEVVNDTDTKDTEKTETPVTPEIDINAVLDATSPDKLSLMFRIAAQLMQTAKLDDTAKSEAHESIKGLIASLAANLPEEEKAKIQSALR